MVVPVSLEASGKGERGGEPGRTSGGSPKPRIISELMKKHVAEGAGGVAVPGKERRGQKTTPQKTSNIYSCSPESGDRPRMSGVLQCARSEWTPRWEARYAEVKHGSLELYLPEGSGPPSCGTRPRRRLPLRNLSIRRVPRRHNAFALCPREPHAAPLLLCQTDNAEGFSRWTRTLAVELMRQTPLGDVRFLDILRITEPPRSDDPDDLRICGGRSEGEAVPEEVERLKDLCQRGSATVTERRRLFEALGGSRPPGNREGGEDQRSQLSSRSCASSEDLGQSVMKYPSLPRARPKRAKSLHDLPSDFPVSCTMQGGVPVPISIVSQLRLFFERISQNGTVEKEGGGGWCGGGNGGGKEAAPEDRGQVDALDSHSGWASTGLKSNCVKGQPKKTGRSKSYTCESTRKLSNECYTSYGSDTVFLNNVSQKLRKDVYRGRGSRMEGAECDSGVDEVVLNTHTKERHTKDGDLNGYAKHDSMNKSCNSVKINPIYTQTNHPNRKTSSSLSNFSHSSSSSHAYPSSPPHSLSSESSSFSFLPLATSPSSSCSSLSMQLSTPSSSPPSQLSHQHFLLSSIKKQASESEETIWSLQEEMARLDRLRMAAQRDKKKIYVMDTCTESSYSELEVKLQEEELKLDKLYKEAERVLKCIERSVEQEATLASADHHRSGMKMIDILKGIYNADMI